MRVLRIVRIENKDKNTRMSLKDRLFLTRSISTEPHEDYSDLKKKKEKTV